MLKGKRLFAIHTDADHNFRRTKIAEGQTADFAFPHGFVIEDESGERPAGIKSLINGQYPMLHGDDIKHIEGKLLTLCDATFTNKEQREAFKNMVSNALWESYHEHVDRIAREFDLSE